MHSDTDTEEQVVLDEVPFDEIAEGQLEEESKNACAALSGSKDNSSSKSVDKLFTEDFFNEIDKKKIEADFSIISFNRLDWFDQQAFGAFYQVGINPDFLNSLIADVDNLYCHVTEDGWKREHYEAMRAMCKQAEIVAKKQSSNNQKIALLLVYVRAIHNHPDEKYVQAHLRKEIWDFYINAPADQTDLKEFYDALASFSLVTSEKKPIDAIIKDTACQSDKEISMLRKHVLQHKLAKIEKSFEYKSGWHNRTNFFWKLIFCFTYYNPQTKEELTKLRASFFDTLKIYITLLPDDKGYEAKIKAYQYYQQSPAVKININAGFWAKWQTKTSGKIDDEIKELKKTAHKK